jgi:flagellar protein FliL
MRKRLLKASLIGGLFLIGLVGGGAAYLGPDRLIAAIRGGDIPDQVTSAQGRVTAAPPMADSGERSILLMEDHIVNLISGPGPSTRFARIRIAVVYNPSMIPIGSLQEKRPYLRDAFHGFVSQLTERDLEGTFGLVMLREELLRRARAVTGFEGIREILITDLVIQ